MAITRDLINDFAARYDAEGVNRVLEHAMGTVGAAQASRSSEVAARHTFEFSITVPTGDVTNQEKSGRCWLFASLNSLRNAAMASLNVKTIEFSQSYLFFYDKIEKANTFLTFITETAGEPLDDRRVRSLLTYVASDGGDWDYFCALVRKWGLVPHQVMPDTYNATHSDAFVEQMNLRLTVAAARIRAAHAAGDQGAVEQLREEALANVYTIVRKALGNPPERFDFDYRDKDDTFHRLASQTPQEFFARFVGEDELSRRVLIAHDPRPEHPCGRRLRVDEFRSVYEAGGVSVLNVELEEMKRAVIAQLRDGKAVYFTCDVGRDCDRKAGIMDPDLYRYEDTLAPLHILDAAERARFGLIAPTHAMSFTGVNLGEDERPLTWRVENSWGEEYGKKGVFSMSDTWFDLHMVSCVVERTYLSVDSLAGLESDPIVLPIWDALFGTI